MGKVTLNLRVHLDKNLKDNVLSADKVLDITKRVGSPAVDKKIGSVRIQIEDSLIRALKDDSMAVSKQSDALKDSTNEFINSFKINELRAQMDVNDKLPDSIDSAKRSQEITSNKQKLVKKDDDRLPASLINEPPENYTFKASKYNQVSPQQRDKTKVEEKVIDTKKVTEQTNNSDKSVAKDKPSAK